MDASGEGGKGMARKVGMDGTDVTVGLGVGVGPKMQVGGTTPL